MNRQLVGLALLIMLAVAGCSTTTPTPQPTPTEEQLCADGIATVFAWEDSNGNGFRDGVELPLGGVSMSILNHSGYGGVTEADGKWASDLIYGGCGSPDEVRAIMDAGCRGLRISASPPVGYAATTETTTSGCDVQFGFMRVSTSSPSEPTSVVASCEESHPLGVGPADSIWDIEVAEDSAIWIAGTNGVARLDPKSNQWEVSGEPEGLPADGVSFVTPDRNGTAWAGFWDGPPYFFDGEHWAEFAGSGQIQADKVRAVSVAPDESVWFATSNGAYQWDRKSDAWRHYTEADGLYSNELIDILFTPDGKVWFVTYRGVSYLYQAKVTGTAENWPFGVATTSEDGKVWFDGELYFDSVSQSWADTVYRPSGYAYDFAVDGRGGLWVATDDGALYIPDPVNSPPEEWQRFNAANGLGGNSIRSLATAKDGIVWFGSENARVSRCTFGQ